MSCSATYNSDGTGTANHASITRGTDSDTLDMTDAGGWNNEPSCPNKSVDTNEGTNFYVRVSPAGALE